MKWYFDLKTSVKLISAFVVVALILGFVGFFGLNNMGKLSGQMSSMYDNNLTPVADLSHASILYQRIRVNVRDMNTVAKSTADKDQYKQKNLGFIQEIESNIAKYRNKKMTSEEQTTLTRFDPAWQEYIKLMEQAFQLNYANASSDEFTRFLLEGGFKQSGDQVQAILEELVTMNIKMADETNKAGQAAAASAQTVTIVIVIAALLISVAFGYFISRIISRPLTRMVGLVGKVASGDLRETSDIDNKDEIGQLADSINRMILSLRTTVGGILSSAQSVSAASQQISASTEEIASGSTSQANAAETMTELFKELSAAIHSVARGAEQASELSDRTMGIAQSGGQVVHSSIEGMTLVNQQMSRLTEDSNKIGEIIEVIDDIAEQTNLLALNAAIEAARAGDQGRGFAVVADEVRKLAERSGEATKQITSIIKGMQENTRQSAKAVEEGVVSSRKTGEAFQEILSMVTDSAEKVTEIAAASEEQSAQSSEVMMSIESISAATEEAAASSEETAATAQSLAQLAEDLNDSVQMFKVN